MYIYMYMYTYYISIAKDLQGFKAEFAPLQLFLQLLQVSAVLNSWQTMASESAHGADELKHDEETLPFDVSCHSLSAF